MYNIEEVVSNINKELNKLQYVIEKKAVFKLFGTCLVEKKWVDDIVCFVESHLPSEYIKVQQLNPRKLQSVANYKLLLSIVKNKFFGFPFYNISLSSMSKVSVAYLNTLKTDLKNISENDF